MVITIYDLKKVGSSNLIFAHQQTIFCVYFPIFKKFSTTSPISSLYLLSVVLKWLYVNRDLQR